MNIIDTRTVILLASVMAMLMTLVLYFLRRSYPPSIRGLGLWAAAPPLLCVATLMAGLRGNLPEALTIVIPNLLWLVGLYLNYLGSQRFYEQPSREWRWSLFMALVAVPVTWYTLVEPSFDIRLHIMALSLALLYALHARLLCRFAAGNFAVSLLVIAEAGGAVLQLFRIMTLWLWPENGDIFNRMSPQAIFLAIHVLLFLLLTVGMVLVATDRLRAEFEQLAARDSLTNAYTRRHMDEACQQELERSRRHGRAMSLLLMDLDHFKAINDSYGHQRGDQVLTEFVRLVKGLLRRPDQLGRFGGEEFMLLLPETPLEEALAVAERIRLTVDQSTTAPHVTVSIGVTTTRHDNDTLDTLLARADKALYRAKAQGRNRVEYG